jgi:amidase
MRATGCAWEKRSLERAGTSFDETSMTFIHTAEALAPEDLMLVQDRLDAFRSHALQWFQGYDLILAPVNATSALPLGPVEEQILNFSYTMTHNLTGWPTAVVRAGTSADGLPIGVQLTAHPWREDVALAAAEHVEKVFGGWQKPPL